MEESAGFGPGSARIYRIERRGADPLQAEFAGQCITVRVPAALIRQLAGGPNTQRRGPFQANWAVLKDILSYRSRSRVGARSTCPATSCRLTRRGTRADNRDMDREKVVAILREHEMELRAAGVTRLSLFGSTARGDQRPDSDIDLLAAFDNSRRISLLDVAGIERQIARMLGRPVELVEEATLKPRVRKNAESEAVRAF